MHCCQNLRNRRIVNAPQSYRCWLLALLAQLVQSSSHCFWTAHRFPESFGSAKLAARPAMRRCLILASCPLAPCRYRQSCNRYRQCRLLLSSEAPRNCVQNRFRDLISQSRQLLNCLLSSYRGHLILTRSTKFVNSNMSNCCCLRLGVILYRPALYTQSENVGKGGLLEESS